jgi:outer membrane protein TolC
MKRRTAAALLLIGLGLRGGAGLAARELSFEEAVRQALAHSRAVEGERIRLRQTGERLAEARAALFPQVSLESSARYLTNPPDGVVVRRGELGSVDFPGMPPVPLPVEDHTFLEPAKNTHFQLTATLTQPIFGWLKIRRTVDLARVNQEAAAAGLRQRERRVWADLHAAYFGAVLARESLALFDRSLQVLQSILDDRRQSFQAGLITRQEVLEAESDAAQARLRIAEAREAYATGREALRLLTGVEGELDLSSGFREEEAPAGEPALLERTLAGSPEREALERRLEAARLSLAREQGGAAPRLDLYLAVAADLSGQTFPLAGEGWPEDWDPNLVVSLGARGTLFDAGRSRHRVAAAREEVRLAENELAQAEESLRLQVRRAVEAARTASWQVEAARAALALEEEREKNARVAYENEAITREMRMRAEAALLLAGLQVLQAGYNREAALARLEVLAGP